MFGILPSQALADSHNTMTGSGTSADPYIIMTLGHLNAVRDDLSAHYKLGADINASETASWNNGEGFVPIGGNGNASSQFTGVFDGQSHVISNLTINIPTADYIGLFGFVGTDGVVINVGLEDGSISGALYVGGLVGLNRGTVEHSYISGVVSTEGNGNGIVGGLVGYNGIDGTVTDSHASATVSGPSYVGGLVGRNDSTLSASYATGNVNGTSIVGGLVGDNENGAVTQSYATGTVNGSEFNIGGLVGYNIQGMVSQSYATGSVSGHSAVGGLVGITSYGLVSQSYATGTVDGTNYVGGLVGNNSFATINESYAAGLVKGTNDVGGLIGLNSGEMMSTHWDMETSGRSSACGSNTAPGTCVATGLTTEQAVLQASYPGWDFTGIWIFDPMGYPTLRAIDVTPPTISILMKTADENEYIDNTWTNQNVTVTASAYDAKSGLASIAYSTNEGETWSSYTSAIVLQGDSVYKLSFKAVDIAGNETVEHHRTVRISTSGLMLTPMLMNEDGSAYTSGAWTNESVIVSVYAEAGAVGINDLTYSLDDGALLPYVNEAQIVISQEGTHTIVFQLMDNASNIISEPLEVNIEKTAPSVSFGMNGGESWMSTAQTTVTATDIISGVDTASLWYVWTTDTAIPTSGWTSLTSGDVLTKSGVNGDWYVHIQVKDTAGNMTNIVSNRFRMDASTAALSALTVSSGTLNPAFLVNTTSYTLSVGNDVSGLGITAVTADSTDTIMVNINGGTDKHIVGGVQSEPLTLNVGNNTITLVVTALNGMQQIYTVSVARSSNSGSGSDSGSGADNDIGSDEGNTPPVTTEFISMEGGTSQFNGGQIFIPGGALDHAINLTVNEVINTKDLPLSNEEQLVSKVIELKKDQSGKFNQEVIISLQFTFNSLQKQEVKVSLYWLNEETGEWVELNNTVVDWEKGIVSGATDHFTKFAVLATSIQVQELPPEKDETTAHFTDIRGHWAEVNIQQLAEKNVVNGYPDGSFKPDRTITRAEFVAILVSAFELPSEEDKVFTDTTDHWASQAISTAYANGFIHGYDQHTFAPDELITREQMVTMVANALQIKNVQEKHIFADQGMISLWAQQAVSAAVEHGMIAGYPDNTMKPKAYATRAEAVTVIWQAIE